MKVRWKKGARVGVKAEVAHRFLERIRTDNGGKLQLAEVVRQSKPKNAPLHNEFEWDDKKCGELYRQEQARYIIRKIEVVRPEMPNISTRAYESVTVSETDTSKTPERKVSAFMSVEDVLSNPAARAELLGQAVRDALAFRRRYAALSELSNLIHVIDEEVKKLA